MVLNSSTVIAVDAGSIGFMCRVLLMYVGHRLAVLERADVDSVRAELGGTGRRWRIRERVIPMRRKLDRAETGGLDQRAKLSFQESTGNSAGPQGDVGLAVLRHRT